MAIDVFFVDELLTVVEGNFLDGLTVYLSSPAPVDDSITVSFSIVPDTATPWIDYIYKSPSAVFDPITGVYTDSLIIPGGSASSRIAFDVLDDSAAEGNETFNIVLNSVTATSDVRIGSNDSITVAIADDRNLINQVSIAAIADATESGSEGQFTVSLTEVAATDTVIAYTVAGTAEVNADYRPLAGTVTIPAGSVSATINVVALDDSYLEGNETVVVNLHTITAGDSNVALSNITTAAVAIADDASTILYRVNAGGPQIAALDDGPNWLADGDFLVSPGSSTMQFPALEAGKTVPATTPGNIFDTERFDPVAKTGDTEMQYAFDVVPGVYEVRLYMGNGFAGTSAPGQRVFDVAIEGQVLPNLDNIDLSADFGHLVGGVIANQVVVVDDSLNLNFLHDAVEGIHNPLVNGIEIIQVSDVDPLPTLSVVGESHITTAQGKLSEIVLLTSEPVPDNQSVTATIEIIPGTGQPLGAYVYDSETATFDPSTGVYTDTVTIPSGFSTATITVDILQDTIQEGSGAFSINVVDVTGANFEIGTNPLAPAVPEVQSSPTSSIVIEAEATEFTNYQLKTLTAASGKQVLELGGSETDEVGGVNIDLDTLMGFSPGEYAIVLGTFDWLVPVGQSTTTFSATLNGTTPLGEISLRSPLETASSIPGELTERAISTGVQLGVGDTLTITGFENPDEVFWLDYIRLSPVEPGTSVSSEAAIV
ncbi:MAG: hypothetical protein F6K31_24260 [Symploca sp. SIO2G7]|nr:hypothetical protein [Symploca sp. SIO2G7]